MQIQRKNRGLRRFLKLQLSFTGDSASLDALHQAQIARPARIETTAIYPARLSERASFDLRGPFAIAE